LFLDKIDLDLLLSQIIALSFANHDIVVAVYGIASKRLNESSKIFYRLVTLPMQNSDKSPLTGGQGVNKGGV